MRLVQGFSKKLNIADTAKVIQEKIKNITQVVVILLARTTSRSSGPSSVSATALPVSSDSTRSRPEKWSSSGQASWAWHSTSRPTMLESSSSATTGTPRPTQTNPGGRHRHQDRSHCGRAHRRGDVGQGL